MLTSLRGTETLKENSTEVNSLTSIWAEMLQSHNPYLLVRPQFLLTSHCKKISNVHCHSPLHPFAQKGTRHLACVTPADAGNLEVHTF